MASFYNKGDCPRCGGIHTGLAKAKRSKRRRRIGSPTYLKWLDKGVKKLAPKIMTFFTRRREDLLHSLSSALGLHKSTNPDGTTKTPDQVVEEITFDDWTALTGIFDKAIFDAFLDSSKAAWSMIGFDASDANLDLVNEQAVAYARDRSAGLVGMSYDDDGNLIENPNSAYAITDSTREEIRGLVEDAVQDGWSADDLADELGSAYAFSDARAETIARTELAFAHTQGNLEAWGTAGVQKKQWILGSEHDMDDECNDNADSDPIDIDDTFPSGDDGPPAHPNCVCDLLPVFDDSTVEDDS